MTGTKVLWQQAQTLEGVLDKAVQKKQMVFVDMYTTWCLPCKVMDEEVYNYKPMGDYLNEHFVNYKVDAEKGEGSDLHFLFSVRAFPTLLWLDTKGREVHKVEGSLSVQSLMQECEIALEKYKTKILLED